MKLTSVFLVVILIATAGLAYTSKGALACELSPVLGYTEVMPNLFLPSETLDKGIDRSYLTLGAERVDTVFGKRIAKPTIVVVDDTNDLGKFFSGATAVAHLTALGNCVVLGPKGQNIDVTAHELVHAEVYARLGWFKQLWQIPKWFEEGMALMVDYRDPFLPENIELSEGDIADVKLKFYGHQFYTNNQFKHFQAARLAVKEVNPEEFYQKLGRIKQGESFDQSFAF